ncbi:MAG: phosphate transporter substrate-binding protein PhoT family [Bacteroidota bacterium]|jgi:phosphate transport system substrate-binding protein|nr:phosphate transporter substrate-binding protein PhoT family [Bacteroidota bacterium]
MKNKHLLFLFCGLILWACSGRNANEPTDTPTSGEVKIVVDESFQKLFETQIYTFESIYPNAKVHATYISESDALQRLINDSCKVVVLCRDLTSQERKSFEAKNIFPISTKIAEDGIAILLNPENKDTAFTVDRIKSMLMGTDSLWTQVNPGSDLGKISVVFDNSTSANARYMQDTLLQGKKLGPNAFAVKSNPEVIDYVSKHTNAIGILSVNWISDLDDPKVQAFLKTVKVAAVAHSDGMTAVKPYQAYIKTKEYPFTRDVYMINRQTRAGLGMGFVSFVAGDKGQLMILKAGLIPAIAPVRMVQINTQ